MSEDNKELAATRKQLKINTGVVKRSVIHRVIYLFHPIYMRRLLKEYNLYKTEAEEQKRKVDKYIADGKDEYDVRNQASFFEFFIH